MSVDSVSSATFDAELKDDDFDPVFELVSVMAEVSEEFTDWYEQVADELETASEWLNWIGSQGRTIDGTKTEAEVVAFTDWMDSIGFNYTKYFNTSETDDGETKITKIDNDYEVDEVNELLALEVETISSNAEQAKTITTGMISDYNSGSEELISFIDTLRSAWRGHIRS